MEKTRKFSTVLIAIAGVIIVAAVMIGGTIWMGRSAQRDTVDAVRTVSLLYLDELAGRREEVVENNLKDNIRIIDIAVDLIDENDLQDLDHLRSYQRKMKHLFSLQRFSFVDTDGLIYTADEGIVDEIDQYSFDYKAISAPDISIKNLDKIDERRVVIAVPIHERNLWMDEKQLVVCFMELSMDVMLKGVSLESQGSSATFCNIYTSDGVALSNTILGGLAVEDNLLDAMQRAEVDPGYSLEQMLSEFTSCQRGQVAFTYDGIQETLSYNPIQGTNWLLTFLVRDSVISDRISGVTTKSINRSLLMSLLSALLLALIFVVIILQNRRNARLILEKETAEAANQVKHQEMTRRLALQEELLQQKAEKEKQEKMIAALASDYRSVYYVELDKNTGICYQARTDMAGLHEGEQFSYLEAVTAYCNQYILPEYREEFLRFIEPDAIREALKESDVIQYRYIMRVNDREAYEAVRFVGIRNPGDQEDHIVRNVGACFMDVDEEMRKSLREQQILSDALTTAEQANKAKTAFLSNMSHEIRTPMNAIIGLNNIAMHEPSASDKVKEYLAKIGTSAQHLLGIINDILDMSRIESGRMVIKKEEFSFSKSLEQVNGIISEQCRDKDVEYECRTIGRIDDYYIGDAMKLKQVMINILGNAVKFTPSGGKVSFLIEEGPRYDKNATIRLTFRDTGIGMSSDYIPHIFDPFSQEDSSSTNKYGSTGLGMPITKSIVELMNGHIEVESEKGKGTTFTVTVTLGEAEKKSVLMDNGDFDVHGMRVLVIDDDPVALEHAQIILGNVGITCDLVSSGQESLNMVQLRNARSDNYDLILVDWRMPEMDGVETTRRIRSLVGNETPIIILTSFNWDDVEEEARNAGVDTFVPKPLFAGSVLDEFREAFKKKKESLVAKKADLTGRRMLLAEDVTINADIMVMVLSMREIDVDVAENGKIAVDFFTKHEAGYYDAILMDMRMPEMDGLEATRVIRASGHPDAEDIPIIALTANAFNEDVQRSLQAGLNAHLSKPVEPDALFETLENLIGAREN